MLQLSTTLSEPNANGHCPPQPAQATHLLDQGRPADALALCEQALQAGPGWHTPQAEAQLCVQAARACAAMGLLRRADTLSARAEALFQRGGHSLDPQRLDNLCNQLEHWLLRLEDTAGRPAGPALQRCLALREPCAALVQQAQALQAGPLLARSCDLAARLQLLLGATDAAQAAAALAVQASGGTPADAGAQARLVLLQAGMELAQGQPAAAQARLATLAPPADPSLALRLHLLAARAAQARHDWPAAHAQACAFNQAWELQAQQQAGQQHQVHWRDMETAHAHALQLLADGLRRPLQDILRSVHSVRTAAVAPGVPGLQQVRQVARGALQATDRSLQLARALLDPVLAPGTVDLAEAADDACACMGAQAQAAGLALQLELDPPAWVQAPRALLHDGLVHLLGKALQHTPRGGQVRLRVDADTGFTWHVQLADQGPGFAARATAAPHPALLFVERMTHRLGGSLRAGNRPEGGALVELWLPAAVAPGT